MGTLQPKITEMKDIFKLYACGINLAFEFEGKAYYTLSQMSQARRPLDATRKLFEIKKKYSNLMMLKEYIRILNFVVRIMFYWGLLSLKHQ